MNIDLTNPIFHDEQAARKHLEATRWPDGPWCPHCGSTNAMRMKGKTQAGMFLCRDCRDKFTVRSGTVMERSHVPLAKWLLAFRLLAGAKKGMSAMQLGRTIGVTYKTAWFLGHRIRECMRDPNPAPIGGTNKVVEADESFFGGKAKNRAHRKEPPKKEAVMTLLERDGEARSFHIADVTAKTLREALVTTASRASYLMTDDNAAYIKVGKEYAGHGSVIHSKNEYARGGFWHVNTAECHFSLMKRSVFGSHHVISEAHLFRYLAEWDFKFNTRNISDSERTTLMVRGAEGKRLLYDQPRQAAHA